MDDNGHDYRILIEGTKLAEEYTDGINRYVQTLLKALNHQTKSGDSNMTIDVKVFDEVMTLDEAMVRFLGYKPYPGNEIDETQVVNKSQDDLGIFQKLKSLVGLTLYKIGLIGLMSRLTTIVKNVLGNNSQRSYDLVHFTLPQIMDCWEVATSHLVTIHDTTHNSHGQFHQPDNVRNAVKGFEMIKERQPYIHSVSEATLSDMINVYGNLKGHSRCIHEAIDDKFLQVIDKTVVNNVLECYGLVDCDYILTLATDEPRKNLANAAKAFSILKSDLGTVKLKFVVAGKPGWKSEKLIEHPDIIRVGYVPDEALRVLYRQAVAFSFVSHYEGFGLPPLEAMACGTVPVYGDNSAMREIIGVNGLAAMPQDAHDIASKFKMLVSDTSLRFEMEAVAQRHALKFTTATLGKEMAEYYLEIIKKSRTPKARFELIAD